MLTLSRNVEITSFILLRRQNITALLAKGQRQVMDES